MKTLLAVLLSAPLSLFGGDYSLSLFADGAASFTTHGDTQEAAGHYKYIRNAFGPNEDSIDMKRIQAPLQAGAFQLPSSFDLGVNVARKNLGLGLGYKQVQPFTISHLHVTYSGEKGDVTESFDGSAFYNSLYLAPFLHFQQDQNSFLQFECRVGFAALDGKIKNIYSNNVVQAATPPIGWEADYHFSSKALMIEPTIRQGWFISKHAALSVELSYTFLQFTDLTVDPASNVVNKSQAPSGLVPIFAPHPQAFRPTAPDFTVDASSFFVRIRLETFLFNAFHNPPEPPVIEFAPEPTTQPPVESSIPAPAVPEMLEVPAPLVDNK